MKKTLYILASVFFLFSCQKNNENTTDLKSSEITEDTPKEFEMYQMSEMAALMEQMYIDNERLKEKIIAGESVEEEFPDHFLKIHQAVMTDPSDFDSFFEENAKNFIENQRKVYTDPVNAKLHFNNAINACVECHKVKCAGPIPRIKKLYIQ